MSVLEPRVTSNARLRISIFYNSSYFCTSRGICTTLFRRINLNYSYPPKESCTYRVQYSPKYNKTPDTPNYSFSNSTVERSCGLRGCGNFALAITIRLLWQPSRLKPHLQNSDCSTVSLLSSISVFFHEKFYVVVPNIFSKFVLQSYSIFHSTDLP